MSSGTSPRIHPHRGGVPVRSTHRHTLGRIAGQGAVRGERSGWVPDSQVADGGPRATETVRTQTSRLEAVALPPPPHMMLEPLMNGAIFSRLTRCFFLCVYREREPVPGGRVPARVQTLRFGSALLLPRRPPAQRHRLRRWVSPASRYRRRCREDFLSSFFFSLLVSLTCRDALAS